MKKLISLLLSVVMCLTLCSCGMSEAAKNCQEQIDKIGEVTIASEDAIIAAEKACEELSEKDKEKLEESLEKLTTSREKFDALIAEIDTQLSSRFWTWSITNTFDDGGDHVLITVYLFIDGTATASRTVAMLELGTQPATLGTAEGTYKIEKDRITITWDKVENENGTSGWEIGQNDVLPYEFKNGTLVVCAPDGSELEPSH